MKTFILVLAVSLFSLTSRAQSYSNELAEQMQAQKTITINNKSYDAKTIQIYVQNKSYQWEFLQTVRIPGGESVSFTIGQHEYYFNYGYLVNNSYNKTIKKFTEFPLILY